MDLTLSPAEQEFRDELRDWLHSHDPGSPPQDESERMQFLLAWQQELFAGGWAGVDWPTRYGGRGATMTETAIFFEEIARSGVPLPPNHFGLLLAGPLLMTLGTEEQRDRLLAKVLSGEELWCQGFSEPDAGSDLAAVKTRAIDDGVSWVVTGQKVWTSDAHNAKWCMLLARTDPNAPKHKGLTFFILDMKQEGVTYRPLRQINGNEEFNELFLDGARVPYENVIGQVGEGWKAAMTTLMNERAAPGFFDSVRLHQLVDRLTAELASRGLLDNPLIADRLGQFLVQVEVLRVTATRDLVSLENYGQRGPEGSITKLIWQETYQQVSEFAADVLGPDGLTAGTPWSGALLSARSATIEGGSREILKTIIAERILGLPRVPRGGAQ